MQSSERDLSILEKMLRYIDQIHAAQTTFGQEYEILKVNSVYQNAVAMCLLQLGELSNRLSETFKETHREIPWASIRGLRNMVAHEYGSVDPQIIWETVIEDIPVLEQFCRNILNVER